MTTKPMGNMLFRIAERVLNRPLLVHRDKVPLILSVLEGRIPIADMAEWRDEAELNVATLPEEAQAVLRGPSPGASRFVGSAIDEDPATGAKKGLPYRRTADGIAVIPVIGSLINRGAFVGSSSGETSYEGLKFQIATAAADPRTHAVLLDIESPGGEATGAFETADAVRALAAKKPVHAIVNGMAASAAYAIAASARKIITGPSGVVGSIGVVMMHADYSRALDKAGVTPTLIFAGEHKVDGHPFGPLPDAVREDLQREVNQYYDLFVQSVAAGRRGLSATAIRATEARVFIGADAVEQGLADEVGSFEGALADLSAIVAATAKENGPMSKSRLAAMAAAGKDSTSMVAITAAMPRQQKETTMEPKTETTASTEKAVAAAPVFADAAALTAAYPALCAELQQAGAAAERARILGIEKIAPPGHEAAVGEMKADGKTSPEQAAMRILEAEKATRGKQLQAIRDVETVTSAVKGAASAAGAVDTKEAPKASTPEEWKAEWAADATLRTEFPSAETYAAYMAAHSAGKVHRLVSNRTAAA